jgi:(p)ppGpp synthase/HD superfamily hydrolase
MERFVVAVALALELHGDRRLGTGIPFIALLVVCGLVLEDGGDEDQAIAALLHDAAEDAGGCETLERRGPPPGSRRCGAPACRRTRRTPRPTGRG